MKEFNVAENMTLASLRRYRARFGPLRKRAERQDARRWVNELDVRPPALDTEYAVLSGGNQQKVILGKCLNVRPSVLLLEDPTAGVDVRVRAVIYELIPDRRGRASASSCALPTWRTSPAPVTGSSSSGREGSSPWSTEPPMNNGSCRWRPWRRWRRRDKQQRGGPIAMADVSDTRERRAGDSGDGFLCGRSARSTSGS